MYERLIWVVGSTLPQQDSYFHYSSSLTVFFFLSFKLEPHSWLLSLWVLSSLSVCHFFLLSFLTFPHFPNSLTIVKPFSTFGGVLFFLSFLCNLTLVKGKEDMSAGVSLKHGFTMLLLELFMFFACEWFFQHCFLVSSSSFCLFLA